MKKLITLFCVTAIYLMSGVSNASVLDDLKFSLTEEFRFRDTGTAFFYQYTQFQVRYDVNKYSDVFAGYRLIFRDRNGKFELNNVALPGFTLKYPEQNWGRLQVRTRGEAALDTDPVKWGLNVEPKYNFPWKWTKYRINPYIANEMLWDASDDMIFVFNRVRAGLGWRFTPKIRGTAGYYYEDRPKSHANVFHTSIRFDF